MFLSQVRRTAIVLLPVLLVACASTSNQDSELPEKPLNTLYSVAYISKITTTIVADEQPDDMRVADKKALDQKLPALVAEGFEDNGFSVLFSEPSGKAGTVLVSADVQYNPGNRALRWLAGPLGAGKATIQGRIAAVDALTGAVIATKSEDDTVRMGMFGGDFYGEVEDFVEDLASDMAEELAEKSQ